MKTSLLRFALPAFCVFAASLQGQQPAAAPTTPSYSQSLTYIKVAPGKGPEWVQLVRDSSVKAAQVRADAGEILTWTLLRSVYPSGQEARADYLISVVSEGAPRPAVSVSDFEAQLKKGGANLSAEEVYVKRAALASVVATELWRMRERVGAPAKGHYLYINYMKVLDAAAYYEFESNIWRPLAVERVKRGEMSGWVFATKVLPAGTETPHAAYSADMFPSWDAVFKGGSTTQSAFAAAHPGTNYEQTIGNLGKLRDLAKRELWVVVERVEKSKK